MRTAEHSSHPERDALPNGIQITRLKWIGLLAVGSAGPVVSKFESGRAGRLEIDLAAECVCPVIAARQQKKDILQHGRGVARCDERIAYGDFEAPGKVITESDPRIVIPLIQVAVLPEHLYFGNVRHCQFMPSPVILKRQFR